MWLLVHFKKLKSFFAGPKFVKVFRILIDVDACATSCQFMYLLLWVNTTCTVEPPIMDPSK